MKIFYQTNNLSFSAPEGERLTDGIFITDLCQRRFIDDVRGRIAVFPREIAALQQSKLQVFYKIITYGCLGKHDGYLRVLARPVNAARAVLDVRWTVRHLRYSGDTRQAHRFFFKYFVFSDQLA